MTAPPCFTQAWNLTTDLSWCALVASPSEVRVGPWKICLRLWLSPCIDDSICFRFLQGLACFFCSSPLPREIPSLATDWYHCHMCRMFQTATIQPSMPAQGATGALLVEWCGKKVLPPLWLSFAYWTRMWHVCTQGKRHSSYPPAVILANLEPPLSYFLDWQVPFLRSSPPFPPTSRLISSRLKRACPCSTAPAATSWSASTVVKSDITVVSAGSSIVADPRSAVVLIMILIVTGNFPYVCASTSIFASARRPSPPSGIVGRSR